MIGTLFGEWRLERLEDRPSCKGSVTRVSSLHADTMKQSLQLRKQKALQRARVKRLLGDGRLRPDQISLAAASSSPRKSALIVRNVILSDLEAV